jgi:hypothetical protein
MAAQKVGVLNARREAQPTLRRMGKRMSRTIGFLRMAEQEQFRMTKISVLAVATCNMTLASREETQTHIAADCLTRVIRDVSEDPGSNLRLGQASCYGE